MRLLRALVLVLLAVLPAFAQSGQGGSNVIGSVGAPTGTCGALQLDVDTTTGTLYSCDVGTWIAVTGGGGGSGTVTSVSSGNLTSLFTVSIATPTTTPAFSFAFATGQTAHEVIGTCGAATTVSLCALVGGDLPSTVVQTNQSNTYTTGAQDFTGATSLLTTTQAASDASTKAASTQYVTTAITNAIAAVNPAVAVLAASTANITGTYTSVAGGIGDTFTVTATGAFTLDGIAISTIGQRVLLKNQTDATQNGIYTATIVGTVAVSPVFTRALDYDQPSDVNNTGAIPVQSGTTNATTSWLLTSNITSIGPAGSAFTYTQFSVNPSNVVTAVSPGVGLCHFAGSTQACTSSAIVAADITNATITGTQLSSTIALPNGATATTQSVADNTTKVATDAFVIANAGAASKAFVTSQYTNSSSGYTNVTGLSFSVAASTNYSITCNLVYQTGTATVGPNFQWTGPSSPTAVAAGLTILGSTSAAIVRSYGNHGTAFSNTTLTPTYASFVTATDLPATVTFSLINGANSGTVQLQAENNATGTITIQAGSSCVMN